MVDVRGFVQLPVVILWDSGARWSFILLKGMLTSASS
jgi:hypothetical protein